MIAFLTGEVVSVSDKVLLLDVNHVGFRVYISARDAQEMPPVGEDVRVYTYMSVREDDISLFGFLSEDDLEMYRQLINVSGIGPKGGLGILSVMTADDVRMAVLAEDAKAIAKAPGIGLKTAQKLILELKDKIDLEEMLGRQKVSGAGAGKGDGAQKGTGRAGFEANRNEAITLMTALGYSASEAMRAVKNAHLTEDMTADEIFRAALSE